MGCSKQRMPATSCWSCVEGEQLRSVRSVAAKLAIVDVKVTGIVTVAPGAVELAERVLDDQRVVSPFDSDFANGIFRSGFASW